MLRKLRETKGFTLIEVVIVIAIGALIIMVVLQAVSNAQQSQRDSTRRQEASQIAAALESFAANNQGNYPTSPDRVQTKVVETTYVSEAIRERGWNVSGSADCDIDSTGYELEYSVFANNRDYELFVCLERGEDKVEIRNND